MATNAMLSVEEYLHTSFEDPEPDYVDGLVVERAMPNNSHSRVLENISEALQPWSNTRKLIARSEIRLRVSASRYRVADRAYFTSPPTGEVPDDTPFIVVEVLSPGDRHDEILEKLDDYERMGVHYIFLANPMRRILSIYRQGSLISAPALTVPEFGIDVPLDRLFL